MSNTKLTITTHSGETVEAMAPVIISASRSTDIPAFFAKWFINRLEAGYCVWYNPFNQKPSYVSFARCKVVVFWTKNPKPLIPLLHELDERGIRYYFQFTLNDYEKEGFDPNVPSVAQRIETFKELSKKNRQRACHLAFRPADSDGKSFATSTAHKDLSYRKRTERLYRQAGFQFYRRQGLS